LIDIRNDGDQLQIDFEAVAGQGYTIYWSEDLAESQWRVLTTVPPGDFTRIETIHDLPPIQSRQRYYMLSTP